jgi:hypothetical protein
VHHAPLQLTLNLGQRTLARQLQIWKSPVRPSFQERPLTAKKYLVGKGVGNEKIEMNAQLDPRATHTSAGDQLRYKKQISPGEE